MPKLPGRILKLCRRRTNHKAGDTLAQSRRSRSFSEKLPKQRAKLQQQLHKHKWRKTDNCRPTLSVKAKQKGLAEQYEYRSKIFKSQNVSDRQFVFHKIMMRFQNYRSKSSIRRCECRIAMMWKLGQELKKNKTAIGQKTKREVLFQEVNVAYSERYIIANNDMET